MQFEMRKLTSFPMKKLCYDLKLEMFEQMEPNDAIELVKVNAGFRSILLRKPWIVFGRHVHKFYAGGHDIIIEKFSSSSWVQCRQLNADLHFSLIERIHSCDEFEIYDEQFIDGHSTILNQLKSVKRMQLYVNGNECLLKFLENFRSMIEFSGHIYFKEEFRVNFDGNFDDLFKENQVIKELFENFMTNQVNDCEEVGLYYSKRSLSSFRSTFDSGFHLYYNAFVKTSIKGLIIQPLQEDHLEGIVQSIVKKGIPSKNLKATFRVYTIVESLEINSRIVDFLSQFPGMKRFDGENQPEVIEMATERLKAYHEEGDELDFTDTLFFRQNIDSSRDCVYMLICVPDQWGDGMWTEFCVFYVQPQSEMMQF